MLVLFTLLCTVAVYDEAAAMCYAEAASEDTAVCEDFVTYEQSYDERRVSP